MIHNFILLIFHSKIVTLSNIFHLFYFCIQKISKPLANTGFTGDSEIQSNAAGRTRTGTATNRLILSQVRLPIPPQRLILSVRYSPNRLFYDIIFAYLFQPLFYYSPSFKNFNLFFDKILISAFCTKHMYFYCIFCFCGSFCKQSNKAVPFPASRYTFLLD